MGGVPASPRGSADAGPPGRGRRLRTGGDQFLHEMVLDGSSVAVSGGGRLSTGSRQPSMCTVRSSHSPSGLATTSTSAPAAAGHASEGGIDRTAGHAGMRRVTRPNSRSRRSQRPSRHIPMIGHPSQAHTASGEVLGAQTAARQVGVRLGRRAVGGVSGCLLVYGRVGLD